MPKYNIRRNYGGCKGYSVIGESGTHGCHPTRAAAIQQQRALYAAASTKSHDGAITNEDTPNMQPHSMEDCTDPKNCPEHNTEDNMDKKSPCWEGYVQRGMKPGKDGKEVPNCVPVAKLADDCCPELEKKDYSPKQRRTLAARGQAMSDGSFPIANVSDLRNAIQSVGRAADYEKAKAHISRRARALGRTDLLPSDWKQSTKKSMWGSVFSPPLRDL